MMEIEKKKNDEISNILNATKMRHIHKEGQKKEEEEEFLLKVLLF